MYLGLAAAALWGASGWSGLDAAALQVDIAVGVLADRIVP